MLWLLDTTILIDYLKGTSVRERVNAFAQTNDFVCTTAINVEELYRGLRPKELKAAERLIEGLAVVPLGAVEGRRAGTWRREFAAKGFTLSQPDCLIAAAAWSSGAVLATGNPKDFPFKEVTVENWPSG